VNDNKDHRVKTHHKNRHKKYQFQILDPGQSEGGGEIVKLRTVMYDMRRPPEALFMGDPVRPVPHKIQHNEAQYIRPPGMRDAPGGQVIADHHDIKNADLGQGVDKQVTKTNSGGSQEILSVIEFFFLSEREVVFQGYQGKHDGCRDPDNSVEI
jgi:hypothetical protein